MRIFKNVKREDVDLEWLEDRVERLERGLRGLESHLKVEIDTYSAGVERAENKKE